MGKFKMPSVQEFYKSRRIYNPIKDPVWVYIEREMKENAARKPYNTKVANWLLFLKDLRYHYFCEARDKYNRIWKECGPEWYLEYSNAMRQELANLRSYIHEDLLEDLPNRVRKCLKDLGITAHISSSLLMSSMAESLEDPGVFIWILYTKLYKVPPSVLLPKYSLDAMLLMSALVFIDLEECIERLNSLTTREKRPQQVQQTKKTYYFEPNVRYGPYLQKMRVPCYSAHPDSLPKPKKPMPLIYKFKLRNDKEYERLTKSTEFLEKRKQRNVRETTTQRKCKYKFWDPPATLRNVDPALMAFAVKLKMLKLKPKKNHLKYKPHFENVQCHIGTVVYSRSKPVYLISTMVTLPTGYVPINGGVHWLEYANEWVTQLCGMANYTHHHVVKCEKTCQCLSKWEEAAKEHVDETKCRCWHSFDRVDMPQQRCKENFFYPPKRFTPFLFDHAKIYQLDSYLEHVHDAFRVALFSETPSSEPSSGNVEITDLTAKEILQIFLADLAETPLLIPHLPEAHLLNNLQEWVRRRISGDIGPERHKQLMLKSQRRWLDLKHIDFRAQAYFIPFTLKHLAHMSWSHRGMVQKLFDLLLHNFEFRTRQMQLEQCRLWWSTMAYDAYPRISKSFLDVFFTYMPGRYQDTLVINPYCTSTMSYQGRTCPLNSGVKDDYLAHD